MSTSERRSAVLSVPEVAQLLSSNPWTVYEAVKAGTFPIPPIRVGRKILFARSRVDELLGTSTGSLS
jgi:excisionase family DNA binding protein